MKKITYILGLFSMLTFQSCLDMEPKTQLADTNYWQTPDHFKLFATQFYGWTVDFKQLDDSPHSDVRSDLRTGITLDVYSNGTNSIPSSDKTYTNNYNRIRQVNTLLQQAEGYAAPADIETSVGEAHFFRAYCYFDLLQVYGDVIITRTPLDIDSPEMQMARNSRDEVVDFILEDLEEAIRLLPEANEISSKDEGRLSSQAASAFLSRVALYEGTWQKFRNGGQNNDRSSALLDIAATSAHDVIESGFFELFAPEELGTEAYKYLFILENDKSNPAGITKSGNKEYIFTRRHDPTLASIGFNITQGRLGNAVYVTRKMANMYLQSNGLPINPQTWDYSKVDSEFKDRDNRMSNTLMIPGHTYWGTGGGRIDWTGSAEEIANASHKNFMPSTGTGYFPHKWCCERDGVPTGMEAYDYPIIRYAEVLLNYAEAVFERDDKISDEDLAISLNLTRKRVNPNMPDLTNAFVSANNLDMRTEIRRERTVEFYDENFRIDDLKRWKTAEEEMPMNLTGVKWRGTEYETKWSDASSKTMDAEGCIIYEQGRVWEEKHYLYPLPIDQLKLNPNLKQNPGWE
ncbi:RagB/SusD family nutrient uptake outer membrane protein [Phocaeicola plebeius]|uniref:RagB/SusD family nutrient uptake outer membrane protein n=1 Tax=Phocaeicola plebeius TaxID=310297 RepID=A0A414R7S1_9BACT|nr:RagB/SusD family nutrient uptake outer membrane protein [Phocaeicola plebeius]MBS4811277.1 RagB/SusD family nutrient uptake outer membrane protein [Bacteroides sp.]MBS4825690.1 RagB/SusD family nutrient uptake outer membrane protein [Bacteroides sp.]RGR51767.1 RagB/SusD family nutrient uptake outer membrane protein [Phocaeicola plebeius]RHA29155.1 RagB/SusD family nutrient uptake outer membrane protein [Phocaeicola plebeius]RHA33254.1 RagB/SusD family nutrient uptake outer membrane protein 